MNYFMLLMIKMARLYALQKADMRALEKQGVRENPIRRGGYAGGAAPTQPVRFGLASERAAEIQANRTNPRRSGATPTMGVSRLRGGMGVLNTLRRFIHPVVATVAAGGFGFLAGQAAYYADPAHPSIPSAIAAGLFTALGTIGTYADIVRRLQQQGVPDAPAEELAEAAHAAVEIVENPLHQGQGGDRRSMIMGDRGGDRRSMIMGDRGGRAIPSSGLSQFRGGAMERMVGAGHGSDSDSGSESESDEECEGGSREMEIMARESARRPAIRSGQSKKHSAEAKEMGRHLGKHLLAVRGGGFFDLFQRGVAEAAKSGHSVAEETDMPNPNSTPESVPTTTDFPKSGSGTFDLIRDHPPTDMRLPDPNRRYEPPTTDMGLKPKKRSNNDLLKPYMPTTDRTPSSEINIGSIKPSWMKGAGIFDKPQQVRSQVVTPADLERHRQSEAETMETIRRGRDRLGMPKVITEEDRRRLADYDRRNPSAAKKKKGIVGLGDCGGYLSGQYEGMGDELKFAKQRQDAAAKRRYAVAAARSRMTPAEKEADAKKIAEGLALREKERPAREAEAAAEKKKYDERMERVKPPTQVRKTLKPPAPRIPKLKPIVEGKGRRAPAGPNDGRRKRAEIVKKVMAEKGCSMIEASKYVKAHGLY